MSYIYARTINVDIASIHGNHFITLHLEKVVTDVEGKAIQTIGNFGRIVKRMSDLKSLPYVSDDGMLSAKEIIDAISINVLMWIQEIYGGIIGDGVVVID